jgi:diguanylate cyclase (GGDEF)-like protein
MDIDLIIKDRQMDPAYELSTLEWKKCFEKSEQDLLELKQVIQALVNGKIDCVPNAKDVDVRQLLAHNLAPENTQLIDELRKQNELLQLEQNEIKKERRQKLHQKIEALETAKKSLENKAKKLIHISKTDTLTGLANRLAWMESLKQSIAFSKRHSQKLAIVLLDLDRFKLINDSLGHQAGDLLLKSIAKKLKKCIRPPDMVARLGGDEFVLLLNNQKNVELCLKVIWRIIEAVESPVILENREYTVGCSIGLSIYPDDSQNADTLLGYADTAMYQAKADGMGSFQFYTSAMQEKINKHLKLEAELKLAIEDKQFVVFYQPKVSLLTGEICGLEALLRWQHPKLGLLAPDYFIGIAEEVGLINNIGQWVLDEVCQQNKQWQDIGLAFIPISVNLSPKQLLQTRIVENILNTLKTANLNAKYLILELTENISMDSPDRTLEVMLKLQSYGISISIDDFVTGYSNLT